MDVLVDVGVRVGDGVCVGVNVFVAVGLGVGVAVVNTGKELHDCINIKIKPQKINKHFRIIFPFLGFSINTPYPIIATGILRCNLF